MTYDDYDGERINIAPLALKVQYGDDSNLSMQTLFIRIISHYHMARIFPFMLA